MCLRLHYVHVLTTDTGCPPDTGHIDHTLRVLTPPAPGYETHFLSIYSSCQYLENFLVTRGHYRQGPLPLSPSDTLNFSMSFLNIEQFRE